MKLRTRIFIVSFCVSVLLLGSAGLAVLALGRTGNEASLPELEASIDIVAEMAQAVSQGSELDPEVLTEALGPLKRDIARRTVLEKDRAVSVAATWILFLVAEALAALAVALVAARILTARWTRLYDGIIAIRRQGSSKPFFTGVHDEFGLVEEELDKMVSALSDQERMRSELKVLQSWGDASAFLAHQARTPLASMTMSARTALDTLSSDSQVLTEAQLNTAKTSMEFAVSEALRVTSLFSRVRSMSGFNDPQLVDIDPEKALEEAVARLTIRNPHVATTSIRVVRTGTKRPPFFDKGYLVEAFTNLLNNSVEACSTRGQNFSALVTLSGDIGMYTIEYSDSVTGLDPGILERIGTVRFTTKPDGTGLGVWLVGRIAALHGGTLRIGMTESGGLRFALDFPAGVVN